MPGTSSRTRLGVNQVTMLKSMADDRVGPLDRAERVNTCESLVKRGLAERLPDDDQRHYPRYGITPEGREAIGLEPEPTYDEMISGLRAHGMKWNDPLHQMLNAASEVLHHDEHWRLYNEWHPVTPDVTEPASAVEAGVTPDVTGLTADQVREIITKLYAVGVVPDLTDDEFEGDIPGLAAAADRAGERVKQYQAEGMERTEALIYGYIDELAAVLKELERYRARFGELGDEDDPVTPPVTERFCACGCGQPVTSPRPEARYATGACRVRAHRASR